MSDSRTGPVDEARASCDPSPDDVMAQLDRILSSPVFAQSDRLKKFVRFIVDETLAGRANALKEYTIALDVFDRDESFDPQTSPIVRVEASRLRSKLTEYHAIDGRDDPVEIALPPGSYVPAFRAASDASLRELAPTRPAVAVLPFTNMSGDPEQEYFADGLTEDIITALSRSRTFPVIARNSTFTYKGIPVKAQQVAEELGARYIVEGGVRKGGNQVRITAQLIDADTGHHVWAEKYDRMLDDIFEVQDEITQRIAAIIVPTLERAEQRRAVAKRTDSLDAWDCYLRGKAHLNELTHQGTIEARAMFERAIALDPGYGQAYSELAYSYYRDVVFGYTENQEQSLRHCMAAAQRAVVLDDEDAWAHITLGMAFARNRQFDLALAQGERAMELDPTGMGQMFYGIQLNFMHRPRDGIPFIEKGLELNPKEPRSHFFMTRLADAHLQCRQYEQAIEWAQKAIGRRADYIDARLILAAGLGFLGRESEAKAALDECRRIEPAFTETWHGMWFYLNPDELEPVRDVLSKAGLAE